MRRHINAAILAGGAQAEYMVILVDGAADRAQAVVTIGQHIGNGELFQTTGAGGLDNAHKGNVMRGQAVKG